MFRGCTSLKSCVDTRNLVNGAPEEGNLNSETFFVDLINLNTIYPSNVFAGCIHINMDIISYDNNTLLFHTSKNISDAVIDNTLYNGINLIGEIKNNVFGGINNVIVKDNKTYYIPVFTSIKSPFDTGASNNAKIRISEMGSLFKNINTSIRQAIGIFRGLKVHEEDSGIIPADIFKGCINLISIESFFSGLNLTNGGNSYVFPATYIDDGVTKGMFDDCVNLKITKNLFYGCNQLKIKLVGEGFKNCKLEDVSGMFSNSGLYDVIPYRLFFMVNNNKLQRTIKTMDNIFSGCWCLGYDITRSVAIGRQIYGRKTT
jgi:hypothetical protein